jgi:predicted nuclease with TOPRIM domain
MSAHRDRVTSLAHTTLDLGQKVDTVLRVQEQQGAAISRLEHGQAELRGDVSELRGDVSELRGDVSELRGSVGRIEEMLVKLLDGQAILHQNDMELKRRLDARD